MNKKIYKLKALERAITLFKWKSETLPLPFNPEFYVTEEGSIGYDLIHKRWVHGSFTGYRDEYGDFTEYVAMTLNSEPETYTLKNHKEVVVCGNTPLYRPFKEEREYFAMMKEEIDKSILCLTKETRKNKAFLVDNDRKKKEVERALAAIDEGKPAIFVTSILEGLETVDITDPAEIDKMQYLTSFYQSMEKREANDVGVDLDLIDKRAQVTTNEITQYDDVTTENFLVMYEMRLAFVEEMKKNGLEIEIVRNPIFFDEPEKEDIDEGTFEEAENQEGENNEEENQGNSGTGEE